LAVLVLAACSKPAEPPEPQAHDPASDMIGGHNFTPRRLR